MKLSRVRAAGAVALVAAVAVVGSTAPAFAHVTVAPEGEAAQGGYAVIDFKVPNERDNASTTKLEVTFPYDEHPLASVSPQPVPGWTVKITKSKLSKPLKGEGGTIDEAVSKVTWTADGKGVAPGFFQEFPVSVGSLPEDTDQLVFKALQTYSNKEVVRWIEPAQEGQEEPDNPAPVLKLTAADSGSKGAPAADKDKGSDGSGSTSAASDDSDASDSTARALAIAGIAVGAAGLAFGVRARRRGNAR
ncbi:YcnI family protein [Streptomyces sp. NPDC050560]|uniref:YcnI family protein n=1 Tax=Streptomyces sp. NPDC050560 TaxID=3365630 RepID=UPI0037A8D2BC